MRKKSKTQMNLFGNFYVNHKFSKEMKKISELLDENRHLYDLVMNDLRKNTPTKEKDSGANGMSAEQILRAAIIKQKETWSYRELELHLLDSVTARSFVGLDEGEHYKYSCLQNNIKKISESTWEKIILATINTARNHGIENGRAIRNDCTVVATNIHHPTDSSLLNDCVRVIGRTLKKLRSKDPEFRLYPKISPKKSKKLMLNIINSKNDEKRKPFYKELINGSKKLLAQLPQIIHEIQKSQIADIEFKLCAQTQLKNLKPLFEQIIWQTKRRVLENKKVSSQNKIVSIFEPHTDVIVKGRREVEFGHKILLTTGKSNLILGNEVLEGNPADSNLFLGTIEKHKKIFGKAPEKSSSDGGFASRENVLNAKEMGVKDVCFTKRCAMEITDMVKSSWVYEKLKRFRAGIEGVISFLKRCFGLSRINWKEKIGFVRYVKSAIASYNFTILARNL